MQLCDNANNSVLIENNRVTSKWGFNPFSSGSLVTTRKQTCGNVMFSQACVSHSVQRGSAFPQGQADSSPAVRRQTSLYRQTPLYRQMVNKRAVRILLDCILVFNENRIAEFALNKTKVRVIFFFNLCRCSMKTSYLILYESI